MKHALLTFSWLVLTPVALFSSVFWAYRHYHTPPVVLTHQFAGPSKDGSFYATGQVPGSVRGISSNVQTDDARPVIIAEFLQKHGSPLVPYEYYGEILTSIADKYQLDFRLLPAIMMQESNLCKKIPSGTYNCLGLGIHSRGTWGFENYESNFEMAAKILREKYIDQGLITPEEIQNKYTPHSNGSWEFAVNHFMEVLETADF